MIRMRIIWEKFFRESNRGCLWLQTLLLQLQRTEGRLPFSFFSGAREPKIAMAACCERVIWIKMQSPTAVVLHVPQL